MNLLREFISIHGIRRRTSVLGVSVGLVFAASPFVGDAAVTAPPLSAAVMPEHAPAVGHEQRLAATVVAEADNRPDKERMPHERGVEDPRGKETGTKERELKELLESPCVAPLDTLVARNMFLPGPFSTALLMASAMPTARNADAERIPRASETPLTPRTTEPVMAEPVVAAAERPAPQSPAPENRAPESRAPERPAAQSPLLESPAAEPLILVTAPIIAPPIIAAVEPLSAPRAAAPVAAVFQITAGQTLSAALRDYLAALDQRLQWNTTVDFRADHPYRVAAGSVRDTIEEVLTPYGLGATLWAGNRVVEVHSDIGTVAPEGTP